MGNSLTVSDTKTHWKVFVELGTGVQYDIHSNEERYIVKYTGLDKKMTYHVNHSTGDMTYIGSNDQILAGCDGNMSTLRKILTSMLDKLSPIASVDMASSNTCLESKQEWDVTINLGNGVTYTIKSSIDKYIIKVTGYEQKMVYHVDPFTGSMVFVQNDLDDEIGAGTDGNLSSLREVLTSLINKIAPLCVVV